MSPHDLRTVARHRPFQPFRLFVSDGSSYDVRHPELLMLGLRSVVVGLTADPNQDMYERFATVDLVHVTRIEPLELAKPTGNGQ
jgi:hypothetical protein